MNYGQLNPDPIIPDNTTVGGSEAAEDLCSEAQSASVADDEDIAEGLIDEDILSYAAID